MDEQGELLLAEATNEQLLNELAHRPGFVGVLVCSTQEALTKTDLNGVPLQVIRFEGVDHRQALILLLSGAATIVQQNSQ